MRVQIVDGVVKGYGLELTGPDTFDGAPNDYTFEKYTYTPLAGNAYNPNGFALRAVAPELDLDVFQERSAAMYEYMFGQLGNTTAYRTFCTDTDALNTMYENAGNLALVAFIRSVNDAVWGNYFTTGFSSKTTYRGTLVNGVYPRQTALLTILQP